MERREVTWALDQNRSYVVNDALAAYVETYHRQTEHIRHGLREAEAGKFVEAKDVKKTLARLFNTSGLTYTPHIAVRGSRKGERHDVCDQPSHTHAVTGGNP